MKDQQVVYNQVRNVRIVRQGLNKHIDHKIADSFKNVLVVNLNSDKNVGVLCGTAK